ncbi:MAG: ABC transporter ATP-binding protein [Lentisphaerae bacterium]|nr:ABC transporter ATP-binding protein [Lentisphaerota bacterium]
MSHSVRSTAATYWRLLKYTKPYWKVLTIGILAGMLVGGSLFVTLMFIPKMVSAVEPVNTVSVTAPASQGDTSNKYVKQDPKLAKMLNQATSVIEDFHLPAKIEGTAVTITWPARWQFDIVDARGCIAWQLLTLYGVFFFFAWLIKNVAHYINGFCTRYVGAMAIRDLRNELFRHLTNQSMKFFSGSDTGTLISRCTNDTSALEYSISHSIEDLTNAPLQILGCVCAIAMACRQYDNYALLLLLLCTFPLIILPVSILGRAIRKICKKSYAYIAVVFSRMHETFFGISAVKAFNTEEMENERFNTTNKRYVKQAVRCIRLHMLVSPTMELVSVTAALAFMVYSYSRGVTLSELTALLAPLFMAYRPLKDLAKIFAALQKSMAGADRFFELMDTHMELPEKADAKEVKEFTDKITLENVSFAYVDGQPILSDLNFEIKKGEMVAVVGETGSGKSTIANLIARFYDVSSGSVRIDGTDVRDMKISSLRNMIGVVGQTPIIFNESIAYNISYGTPGATQEDIVKAAKLANAHDFIVGGNHAQGYDSDSGENGCRLSGGEKQRLIIARAILRNPPILILDEATSALDTVTERMVQDALNKAMENRTVFAIAHRLATIRHADKILVIQKGRIAEAGTHEQLMEINGIYRHLYETQFTR